MKILKITWITFAVLFYQVLQSHCAVSSWISNTVPDKSSILNANLTFRNFEAIASFDNYTYVGGQNYVLKINENNASYTQIKVPINAQSVRICKITGQSDLSCSNSILILEKVNSTSILICGTYARLPRCYYMNTNTYEFTLVVKSANRYIPTQPTIPSNHLPAIILNGSSGLAAFIARCTPTLCNLFRLTDTYLTVLESENSFRKPTFLNLYSAGSPGDRKTYLFFRDVSNVFEKTEFTTNGEDNEYGFVARVCNSDIGGIFKGNSHYMTFMRARLLCPFVNATKAGSSYSLHYDSLRSTFRVGNNIYGLFTLPSSWSFQGSAVCMFDFDAIDSHINGSAYPNSQTTYYYPKAETLVSTYPSSTPPPFLPGQCPSGKYTSENVGASFVLFVEKYTLVSKPVKPTIDVPSYVSTENYDFITILSVGVYQVFYLFKADGHLRRVRIRPLTNDAVVLSDSQVSLNGETIKSISTIQNKMFSLVTSSKIYQVNPSSCSSHNDCLSCENDPFCNWAQTDQSFVCNSASIGDYTVGTCHVEPPAPRNVTVEQSGSKLTLHWTSGSSAGLTTNYSSEVRLKSNNSLLLRRIVSSPELQFDLSDLMDGVNYIAEIRSLNINSFSNQAATRTFSKDYNSPELTVGDMDTTSVTLTWNQIPFAKSYKLVVRNDLGKLIRDFALAADGFSPDEDVVFPIGGLSPGRNYEVQMTTISNDDVSSSPAVASITTTNPTTAAETTTTTTTPIPSTTTTTTLLYSSTTSFSPLTSEQTQTTSRPASATTSQPTSSPKQTSNPSIINTTSPVTTTTEKDRPKTPAKTYVQPSEALHSGTRLSTASGTGLSTSSGTGLSTANGTGLSTASGTGLPTASGGSITSHQPVIASSIIFIWLFILFATLALLFGIIAVQNHLTFGFSTRFLSSGEKDSSRWKRTCLFFWTADKGIRGHVKA